MPSNSFYVIDGIKKIGIDCRSFDIKTFENQSLTQLIVKIEIKLMELAKFFLSNL